MFSKNQVLVACLLGAVSLTASADPKSFYIQRMLEKRLQQGSFSPFGHLFQSGQSIARTNESAVNVVEGSIEQKVDPANRDSPMFTQHYFIESSYAQDRTNAPILLYICGEATCESSSVTRGAIVEHARELGAHVVALEHRYYGHSIPTTDLSAQNLRYLTVENALKDLENFQNHLAQNLGMRGKVITFGGSYAGALSAYYRLKYPALVVGALASSGPVRAKANFDEYDRHVATVAGAACAQALRQISTDAETKLENPETARTMKLLFGESALRITDPDDFLYVIADMGAIAVQYGFSDQLCPRITESGITADERMRRHGAFSQSVFRWLGVDAYGYSNASAMNEDPNAYIAGFGLRAWFYQSCVEFGFFQNAWSERELSARSTRINADYHQRLCTRLFGRTEPVMEAETNNVYYQPLLDQNQASKILFTNGSNDPWSMLSINEVLGNNVNPATPAYLIDGASHCEDMGTSSAQDSSSLTTAKEMFLEQAREWLR